MVNTGVGLLRPPTRWSCGIAASCLREPRETFVTAVPMAMHESVESQRAPTSGGRAHRMPSVPAEVSPDGTLADLNERQIPMTYVITSPCIDVQDQSCVEVCPVDCIHFEEGVDRILYIDPDECIDCGACEPACPVSAIFAESDVPSREAAYTEINRLWYEDRPAARSRVP